MTQEMNNNGNLENNKKKKNKGKLKKLFKIFKKKKKEPKQPEKIIIKNERVTFLERMMQKRKIDNQLSAAAPSLTSDTTIQEQIEAHEGEDLFDEGYLSE